MGLYSEIQEHKARHTGRRNGYSHCGFFDGGQCETPCDLQCSQIDS